jgi:hypothetical protein
MKRKIHPNLFPESFTVSAWSGERRAEGLILLGGRFNFFGVELCVSYDHSEKSWSFETLNETSAEEATSAIKKFYDLLNESEHYNVSDFFMSEAEITAGDLLSLTSPTSQQSPIFLDEEGQRWVLASCNDLKEITGIKVLSSNKENSGHKIVPVVKVFSTTDTVYFDGEWVHV